jgi:hypothetical protein
LIKASKSKKEGKKLKNLQNISNEMREAVLSRYFAKCKRKYAFTFFEWRRKRL